MGDFDSIACKAREPKPSVLVTVGTTPFDELVQLFDINQSEFRFVMQTGSGRYQTKYCESHEFVSNFNKFALAFDIIVTHAGAGTVYSLLEMKKKLVVVPNLVRSDHHQLELSSYLDEHGFACVRKLEEIERDGVLATLKDATAMQPQPFFKEDFFYAEKLVDYFTKGSKLE